MNTLKDKETDTANQESVNKTPAGLYAVPESPEIKIQIVGRGMKPRPRPKGRELRLSPFGIPHCLVPAASCGVFSE